MDDLLDAGLVTASPATALDAPALRQRPNQLFQGLLAFLAVVGVGSTVTVILSPPVRLRVVTVERRLPAAVAAPAIAPTLPSAVAPKANAVTPAPRPATRTRSARTAPAPAPKLPAKPFPKSEDCKDPLCGMGNL